MARRQLDWMFHVTHPQTDCFIPSVRTTSKQPHTSSSSGIFSDVVVLLSGSELLSRHAQLGTGPEMCRKQEEEHTDGGVYDTVILTTLNCCSGKYLMQLSDELPVQK